MGSKAVSVGLGTGFWENFTLNGGFSATPAAPAQTRNQLPLKLPRSAAGCRPHYGHRQTDSPDSSVYSDGRCRSLLTSVRPLPICITLPQQQMRHAAYRPTRQQVALGAQKALIGVQSRSAPYFSAAAVTSSAVKCGSALIFRHTASSG